MVITGAQIYTKDHTFQQQDLFLQGDRIVDTLEDDGQRLCAEGLYGIPGLIDLHLHGALGCDVCDAQPESLERIARYEAQHGVLAFCPTTMSCQEERLERIMDAGRQFAEQEVAGCADLVGLHLEGPFLNPQKAGAQDASYCIRPDVAMLQRLQERSGGRIRLVDIAPELEGGMEFVASCHTQVNIALAHTQATYEEAVGAFDAGARRMTHLYNAMPGIHHRQPGPIIAAYERHAQVELIADGVHVHPAMVRFAFQTFGEDRVILVSDSMEATGLADGGYQLGGQAVVKQGDHAVLAEHPQVIAGSVTNLFDCMRNAVKMGIPLTAAVRAATENPAKALGIDGEYGSLATGHYANVLLVDDKLRLQHVICRGQLLF